MHLGRTAQAASREPRGGDRAGLGVCHPGLSFVCSPFWKVIMIVEAMIKRLQKQLLKDALVNLI